MAADDDGDGGNDEQGNGNVHGGELVDVRARSSSWLSW